MKKALIIGADSTGLTAAYELLTKGKGIEVILFEESNDFGGISKTVEYKGNRMDMGGLCMPCSLNNIRKIYRGVIPEKLLHLGEAACQGSVHHGSH